MKNKITYLSLALAFMAGISSNAQIASKPMPKEVQDATNIEFLIEYSKKKALEFEENYNKAVEIANQRNLPISGERSGYSFALVGYDEELDVLKYNRTFNNNEPGSSIQTINAKAVQDLGIIGTGYKVGVWDGGVGLTGHLAFTGGRYVVKDNGNTPSSITTDGRSHAAHVAGTVAAGNFGSGLAKGLAPGSQVYAYNWFSDESEMASAAANTTNPIYVSNHSYGLDAYGYLQNGGSASIFGQYNSDARSIDIIANNAPFYTIVFAAGNDRNPATNQGGMNFNPTRNFKDLLSQGGVSKNTVVVANTRGTDTYTGITGSQSVNSQNPFIARSSSYGPTDDFRIKPDISAKGTDVFSIDIDHNGDTSTKSGTSMAAPSVTGGFVLWQDYYNQLFGTQMRSSTIRGLMAHTAREAGPALGPDFMFGFGLLNIGAGKELMDLVTEDLAKIAEFDLPQGTTMTYDFTYTGLEPLKATLAWNDPAASSSTQNNQNIKRIVNDLDIKVVNLDTNQEYFPWALNQDFSLTHTSTNIAIRTGQNNRDNIEKVEVNSTVPGNYRIIVSHKNNTLTGGSQWYSLIISGAGTAMPDLVGEASIEQDALDNLNVFPNPVNDVLHITGDINVLEGSYVEIFDTTGKRVFESNTVFNNYQPSIDVSSFSSGVYILNISKDNSKNAYKFVKK